MRRVRQWRAWTLLLALLAVPVESSALQVREGFEWNWNPLCIDRGTQWKSCFMIAGCENRRPLFVRRTNPGICDYSSEVRFWLGRETQTPAPRPPEGIEGPNRWSASNVRDPGFEAPNGNTFEILSTREPQSSRFGSMQIDFRVPEDVPITGAGEHYLIMHNLNLTPVVPCTPDGVACGNDVTSNVGGVPGNPSSYAWYGVIAGAFGAGTEAIPYGSVGFAIEVSAEGRGGNHLIDESFLPFSVDGAQQSFPAGTYRVRIWRAEKDGVDTYGYSVLRWDPLTLRFAPLVSDPQSSARAPDVQVPFSRLIDTVGFEIPIGYVGITTAWFGEPTSRFRHVDWDNLIVDW